jgi:predicted metal-dependent enzyme (double-stranded beta helix superfamily)
MTFDPDAFVAECRAALLDDDVPAAVRDLVAAAVTDGAGIDAALGTENPTYPSALYESPELTVQRITWWPGYQSLPHEHRMWAVVGVYDGVEVNRVYRREAATLEPVATHEVGVADVIALDDTAVHSVENPLRTRTAGLHVYGGPIVTQPRSAWGPDGREQPFDEHAGLEREMFVALRNVCADAGIDLDDSVKYDAMRALVTARERARRYLTNTEMRAVTRDALGLRDG